MTKRFAPLMMMMNYSRFIKVINGRYSLVENTFPLMFSHMAVGMGALHLVLHRRPYQLPFIK